MRNSSRRLLADHSGRRAPRKRARQRALRFETLEDRCLLTGVNLDLGVYLCVAAGQAATEWFRLDGDQTVARHNEIVDTCTGQVVLDALQEKLRPLADQIKQQWDNFRDSNRWADRIADRLSRGLTVDDHAKAQMTDAFVRDNCQGAEGTRCEEVSRAAVGQALDFMNSRPESFTDFNAVRTTLMFATTGALQDFGDGATALLRDSLNISALGTSLGSAIAQGGQVFVGGQTFRPETTPLPGPAQSRPAPLPANNTNRIDLPGGRTASLDSFTWSGVFREGDFAGQGGGLSFTGDSGSFGASFDSKSGTSANVFSIHVRGSYTEPGVSCSGSGVINSSSGIITVAGGNVRVSGDLGGSVPGSCQVETFPGTITVPGNVSYTGSYSGAVDPSFKFASGTWTASWSSDAGASGSISGSWRANVERSTFDNSVELVLSQQEYGRRLAAAAAFATADSSALYSSTNGGQIQFDVQNIGSDASVLTGVGSGQPLAGDWDGDGLTNFGFYNAGVWTLDTDGHGGDPEKTIHFGTANDVPIVGDWNGDGADDLGLYNNGVWTLRAVDGTTSQISFPFSDVVNQAVAGLQASPLHPLVGDWDGDGIDDFGYKQSDSFFLRQADGAIRHLQFFGPRQDFGEPPVIPVIGDWNHDGADEIGTFQGGDWEFDLDGAGFPAERTLRFGVSTDIPLTGFWPDYYFDEHRFNRIDEREPVDDLSTQQSFIWVGEDFVVDDVDVTLNLFHPRMEDLDVFLISPNGTRVELFTDVGGGGANMFTNLDDEAARPIVDGFAPFSGFFRPEGSLSAFDGASARGIWTLEVTDDQETFTGEIGNWQLTLRSANTPPELTPLPDQVIDLDSTFTVMASATDAETPAANLRFGIETGPPAASIDPRTGQFEWTPTEADIGDHVISLRVTDDAADPMSDFVMFHLKVDGSAAPVQQAVGNRVAVQDQQLAFTVVATDRNADAIRFSLAAGAPVGATIDPNSGRFTWTPTATQTPGVHPIEIVTTDDSPQTRLSSQFITIASFPPGASFWRNPVEPFDVNADGLSRPSPVQDILPLINELNQRSVIELTGRLPSLAHADLSPPYFYDVNGDGFLTPTGDVLALINLLNSSSSSEGEFSWVPSMTTSDTPAESRPRETPAVEEWFACLGQFEHHYKPIRAMPEREPKRLSTPRIWDQFEETLDELCLDLTLQKELVRPAESRWVNVVESGHWLEQLSPAFSHLPRNAGEVDRVQRGREGV